MTYQEAWQRITTAYVNEELNPYDHCACFVGNLLGGGKWTNVRSISRNGVRALDPNYQSFKHTRINILNAIEYVLERGYTPYEIAHLEDTFLCTITAEMRKAAIEPLECRLDWMNVEHPSYEEALYQAMVVTLEELRKIHIAKGENVDAIPLRKRELAIA